MRYSAAYAYREVDPHERVDLMDVLAAIITAITSEMNTAQDLDFKRRFDLFPVLTIAPISIENGQLFVRCKKGDLRWPDMCVEVCEIGFVLRAIDPKTGTWQESPREVSDDPEKIAQRIISGIKSAALSF